MCTSCDFIAELFSEGKFNLFSQLLYTLSTFKLFINDNSNGTLNPKMPQTDEFYGFTTEVEKTFYCCD